MTYANGTGKAKCYVGASATALGSATILQENAADVELGTTYKTVATNSAGYNLDAKVWVFVDGNTESAYATSSSFKVEYKLIQNAA